MPTKTKKAKSTEANEAERTGAEPGDKTTKPVSKEKAPSPKQAAPVAEAETPDEGGEPKLSKLDVPELQAKYHELVGRESRSTNKRYLLWRCQQAQKGRIPVGPRATRGNGGPSKVLPIRVPEATVAPLGDVQKRLGIRSRNEMFNQALANFLVNAGESELAKQFGGPVSAEH